MYTLTYQIGEEFAQVRIDGAGGHLGTQDTEGLLRTEGFLYEIEAVNPSKMSTMVSMRVSTGISSAESRWPSRSAFRDDRRQ